MKSHLVVALVLAGCGSNSARTVDAAPGDTGGPPATMSLTSTAFTEGGAIPTARTCKGAHTPPAPRLAAAHQTVGVHAPPIGFYGPCPPQRPAHTYQFAVYALDVAKLPGLKKPMV